MIGPYIDLLELENFKSYAGKISFGPMRNFSAICAPNGSGKSNVIDAIAFVCGEQNANRLRVARMRGLICGANVDQLISRKASVKLVFVNEGGNQLLFKRTITDADVNQYRIDNRVVSLEIYKEYLCRCNIDIEMGLFLVYQETIISVAMMNEKERTALFEKISRSGELKAEYERLESEKNDAERIHKFNIQKKRLATAALKSAKNYSELVDEREANKLELDGTKTSFYTLKLYYCEKDIAAYENRMSKVTDEIERLLINSDSCDNILKRARRDQGQIRRRHADLTKQLRELDLQRRGYQPEFIKAKELVEHTKKNIQVAENALKASQEAELANTIEIAQLGMEISDVQRQLSELNTNLIMRDLQLDDEQTQEYNRLKIEAGIQSVTHVEKLEKTILNMKSSEDRLQSKTMQMQDLCTSLQQKKHDLEATKIRLEKLEEFIRCSSIVDMDALENEMKTSKRNIDEFAKEIEKLDEKLVLESDNADEYLRNERLNKTVDKLKRQFNGVHGRIVDLCHTRNENYIIAVTEVLGSKMEYIVVDSKRTAIDCLDFIKKHQLGHEHFIALDFIDAPPIKERLRNLRIEGHPDGGVRLLYDVLYFEEKIIEKAIRFVANNVLICDTVADAKHVVYDLGQGRHCEAVSLDGIFFGRHGKITTCGKHDLERRSLRWNDSRVRELKKSKEEFTEKLRVAIKSSRTDLEFMEIRSQFVAQKIKLEYADKDKKQQVKKIQNITAVIEDLEDKKGAMQLILDKLHHEFEELSTEADTHRTRIHDVEDRVFDEFCQTIGVENIRNFEEVDLKSQENRLKLRLEFEDHIQRLETQLKFETSKETTAQIQKWIEKISNLKIINDEAVRNFNAQQKLMTENENKEIEVRGLLAVCATDLIEINRQIRQANQNVNKSRDSVCLARLNLNDTEANCAQMKSGRHLLLKECKMDGVELDFICGSLNDIVNIVDGNASRASSAIYSQESRSIQIDYDGLNPGLKQLDKVGLERELERMKTEIAILASDLRNIVVAVDDGAAQKVGQLKRELIEITNNFQRSLEHLNEVTFTFEQLKELRCQRFGDFVTQIMANIDDVYKKLTSDKSVQALMWPENETEPYLGGINYHCVPPGKLFQPMSGLSGGEKTIAALALLFAISRYLKVPFFVLDEVDASLDQENINNTMKYIRDEADNGQQFIVVSLRKRLYGHAAVIFGISREPPPRNEVSVASLDLLAYGVEE